MGKIDAAVKTIAAALRVRHKNHSFTPRVELRFLIDGQYLTRTALMPGALLAVAEKGVKVMGCLPQMFDEDVAEVEKGNRFRAQVRAGTRGMLDEIMRRPVHFIGVIRPLKKKGRR